MLELASGADPAFRVASGLTLFGTLALLYPVRRFYFLSERHGGYSRSEPAVDRVQNPRAMAALYPLWMACALAIAQGRFAAPAALVATALGYYFFIFMRWRGVARGIGAPGFMSFWLSAATLLLEGTARFAPHARPLALRALQLDFALIILSAGVSKLANGYARGDGIDFGLVNPMWSYFPRFWQRCLSPRSIAMRLVNQGAWSSQIACALLMLSPWPAARALGAAGVFASFIGILTQIRLGVLCYQVMACTLLFWPGNGAATALSSLPKGASALELALAFAIGAYVVIRPACLCGLWLNHYARVRLPRPLQRALDAVTNALGIIIWRVFTKDILDFHVEIEARDAASGARRRISRYEALRDWRFNNVAESITVACVFNSARYFSDAGIFRERLLRYSRTLPCGPGEKLVFSYFRISKGCDRYESQLVLELVVDPRSGIIEELPRLAGLPKGHRQSHAPGTYAPSAAL